MFYTLTTEGVPLPKEYGMFLVDFGASFSGLVSIHLDSNVCHYFVMLGEVLPQMAQKVGKICPFGGKVRYQNAEEEP